MTTKGDATRRGLALLESVKPAAWVEEARKYYLEHGTFRSEDVARLRAGPRSARDPSTKAMLELLEERERASRK